jgi:hypothetical protein
MGATNSFYLNYEIEKEALVGAKTINSSLKT